MTTQARKAIAYANFLVGACVGAWSLWLISSPMHPLPADHHGGLMAAVAGLCLAPLALAAYATDRLHLRGDALAWWMQVLVWGVVAWVLFNALKGA